MSSEVTKTALRVEISELKGKTIAEAYAFFQPLVGEPDDIDREGDIVDFFVYEAENHRFTPIRHLSNKQGEDTRWGIEVLLHLEDTNGKEVGKTTHSLQELNAIGAELVETFGVKQEDLKLSSYTYYTGSDEPISFD